MTRSYLSHLECPRCGNRLSPHELQGTCTCGSPLFCRYRLADLRRDQARDDKSARPSTLWRYPELLPVQDPAHIVTLGEGSTPLLPLHWGQAQGLPGLWLKDEGLNPTGAFKARGAAVAVSRLRELGIHKVVVSSSGNAGDAWAVYCRRAGIEATIILPDDAPEPMLVETTLAHQALHTFGGHNSRGGRLAAAYAKTHQVFCANTFQEPYRLEGKKTMGLELAEQLGWRLPDTVVYPIGGGVGLIGIWKAFAELLELGWVEGPMPRFVVAQYAGCAPLVDAFHAGREACAPWGDITTLPGGLRAAKPLADFIVLKILRETGGTAIAVSSDDALAAVRDVMATDGMFMCPEAGTTIVAIRQMREAGQLRADETIAVINTATGLKYTGLFPISAHRVADNLEAIPA